MEYLQYETFITKGSRRPIRVLNLIINGIPSIRTMEGRKADIISVLNLIINGIPSIPITCILYSIKTILRFKPYYKWNTFNTVDLTFMEQKTNIVLNLIINGIPSIRYFRVRWH